MKIHAELEAGMNKLDVLELLEAGISRAHMAAWLMQQEAKIYMATLEDTRPVVHAYREDQSATICGVPSDDPSFIVPAGTTDARMCRVCVPSMDATWE